MEERIYTCRSGQARRYVEMYEAEGLAIQRPILGSLVGYFTTEIGPLNQVVHLWAYACHEDRSERRARLLADPAWKTRTCPRTSSTSSTPGSTKRSTRLIRAER